MKLAIRIIALAIVIAGGAAATVSSTSLNNMSSHQSATAANPIPTCTPGLPGCPPDGGSGR